MVDGMYSRNADLCMTDPDAAALPVRSVDELIRDLRLRAAMLGGEPWELPATAAMMREAADALAAQRAALAQLRKALHDFVEDCEARWDMNDPRTNPGIKHCVEHGRAALSASSKGDTMSTDDRQERVEAQLLKSEPPKLRMSADDSLPSTDAAALIQRAEDVEWALERVTKMCASALVDARVYGRKLLKGFGYPNETFGRAQDYRALSIVLALLTARETALQQAIKSVTPLHMSRDSERERAEQAEAKVAALEAVLAEAQQERDDLARQFASLCEANATLRDQVAQDKR